MANALLSCTPITVTDAEMMQQIGRLRVRAWLADGELPSFVKNQDVWLDEHDTHATNWAILRDGRPIAAARGCVHAQFRDLPDLWCLAGFEQHFIVPIASFNRLVVDPEFRELGLSKVIDRARMKWAEECGCRSIVVITHQVHRIRFLESAGFIRLGFARFSAVSWAPSAIFLRQMQ